MKKDILNLLKQMFFSSSKTGVVVFSFVIIFTLVAAAIMSVQIFSYLRPDDLPRVSFEIEEFARMNLVDYEESEEISVSEDEMLIQKILDQLDKGFSATARRIFERNDRIHILKKHLPAHMRRLPKQELYREIDTAVINAQNIFRAKSSTSLHRVLSSMPDKYKDHYSKQLPLYLMEAFTGGVKVFSIITNNNQEMNVTADITRTAAYQHFNLLYNAELYRIKHKSAKNESIENSIERFTFYFSLLLLSMIVILLGIMISVVRIERNINSRNINSR
ncbi:MAG: hypothetical protein CVV49_06855 [Spirochaetae bacterium HGW-Spirochaetae-5]|nr:MAG: hypothetical protein CVV49_06855 [Spirochaetae bacterium HGW-Spirochaetae-5]